MEKKEFLDVTREYFKQLGFQTLKKSKFYFNSDDLTLCMWLQKSDFSELYYFTYLFRLKALHPEIKDQFNDSIWDTIGGRLVHNPQSGFQVEYQEWNKSDYLRELNRLVQKQIIPIMNEGKEYVKRLATNCESLGVWILFKKDDRNRILSL